MQLADEGRSIQKRLISNMANCLNKIDGHIFRALMAQGKVRSAFPMMTTVACLVLMTQSLLLVV